MANEKTHHCYCCGEETEDFDYLPNGKKVYCCGSRECAKDLNDTSREIQNEVRWKAEDDNYERYS